MLAVAKDTVGKATSTVNTLLPESFHQARRNAALGPSYLRSAIPRCRPLPTRRKIALRAKRHLGSRTRSRARSLPKRSRRAQCRTARFGYRAARDAMPGATAHCVHVSRRLSQERALALTSGDYAVVKPIFLEAAPESAEHCPPPLPALPSLLSAPSPPPSTHPSTPVASLCRVPPPPATGTHARTQTRVRAHEAALDTAEGAF